MWSLRQPIAGTIGERYLREARKYSSTLPPTLGFLPYAFDLIELNGDDLRRDPLEGRKATLEMMLAKAGLGIGFNEHIGGGGPTVFAHARKVSCRSGGTRPTVQAARPIGSK
jgi:ATP-dependent DNA ligase